MARRKHTELTKTALLVMASMNVDSKAISGKWEEYAKSALFLENLKSAKPVEDTRYKNYLEEYERMKDIRPEVKMERGIASLSLSSIEQLCE
jgi:hypothetical protein